MNITALREKLKAYFLDNDISDYHNIDNLTEREVLALSEKFNIDIDSIDGIPAPIFFELFS